jgi:hypothetical protein
MFPITGDIGISATIGNANTRESFFPELRPDGTVPAQFNRCQEFRRRQNWQYEGRLARGLEPPSVRPIAGRGAGLAAGMRRDGPAARPK